RAFPSRLAGCRGDVQPRRHVPVSRDHPSGRVGTRRPVSFRLGQVIVLPVLRVPPGDDLLRALVGVSLPSNYSPRVDSSLSRALGAGSMAVAFLVERRSPTGTGVAVIKMT